MQQDYELKLALQQRIQGYSYTQLELVNWLCSEFDISVELSERIVADVIKREI